MKTSQTVIARIDIGEPRIDVIEFIDFSNAVGRNPHEFLDELIP